MSRDSKHFHTENDVDFLLTGRAVHSATHSSPAEYNRVVKRIEDYGLIGDGETAALVSRDGSIDWMCLPRFDSDACFAALLGEEDHGFWKIAPRAQARSQRRYQPDTLILETDFETHSGLARVIDFMPVRQNNPTVIRIVQGLRGHVELRSDLRPRFAYGLIAPWTEGCKDQIVMKVGPDLLALQSSLTLACSDEGVRTDFHVRQGDEISFALVHESSVKPLPLPIDCKAALTATHEFWCEWIAQFGKQTDWPDAVKRSLITLKAAIHRPTGGIIAAPTTSIPEAAAGEQNWDYRYCWLRDATFTLLALLDAGFHQEAADWRNWLLRAVAGSPDKMQIMYRADGGRDVTEREVPWLPGFNWSSPVRIGNKAADQVQLDVFGELMDAFAVASDAGMDQTIQGSHLEDAIVDHVARTWRAPDHGLWELRGEPRHYVSSKVSAWLAIERYLNSPSRRGEASPRTAELNSLRTHMHDRICAEGFDPCLGTFVEFYGSQDVDASLLLLPLVGFLPIEDKRIAGTMAAIERDLVEDGFVRRWKASTGHPNGAFIACTFWLADCQLLQNRREAARKTFELGLSTANDLGLLAEEIDLKARRMIGNFPQSLSHLALVRSALALHGLARPRGAHQQP